MAHHAFITINGANQGDISKGAGASDSIGNLSQAAHQDEILVFSFSMNAVVPTDPSSGNVVGTRRHQPATFTKPLDKSSALLWQALADGESLTIELHLYRTAVTGSLEHYHTIKYSDAKLTEALLTQPDVLDETNSHRGEYDTISFSYGKVEHTAEKAGTTSSDDYKSQKTN